MLDAPELAEVLNVSVRTVWRWVRAGRIRAVKIGPQATRFTYEEVERVVHGRTQAVRALLDQHRPEPSTRRPT
jgi:excisionase family DNA binding protein